MTYLRRVHFRSYTKGHPSGCLFYAALPQQVLKKRAAADPCPAGMADAGKHILNNLLKSCEKAVIIWF